MYGIKKNYFVGNELWYVQKTSIQRFSTFCNSKTQLWLLEKIPQTNFPNIIF